MSVTILKSTALIEDIILSQNLSMTNPIKVTIAKNSMDKNGNIEKITTDKTNKECETLIFDILFENMRVEYIYRIDENSLRFDVNAIGMNKSPSEISIEYHIPFFKEFKRLFIANEEFPANTNDFRTLRTLQYRKDFMIPLLTFYGDYHNNGISIIAPIEIPKPSLNFSIDPNGFFISFSRLRSSKSIKCHSGIYIIPHENDWRPGFAFLANRYHEYFHPASDSIYNSQGWYFLADAFDTKDMIERAKRRKVKWIELHGHFPFYGLYAPSCDKWGIIIDSDDLSYKTWSRSGGKKINGYHRMKTLINDWRQNNVKTFLYFQSFECWYQYADKYYAQYIARDKHYVPHSAWKLTRLMNPDPDSKWGKHIIKQFHRLLTQYSDIDGIFYDRMDYWNYDFAHDDKISMIDDKPVYMLGFAFEKLNDRLFRILHDKGKCVWGNNPSSIEVCKYLDGIMAESHIQSLLRTQYMAIFRPLVFLAYDQNPRETEAKLKNALLSGAFPSLTYGDSICVFLDSTYSILFNLLKNRKWVLDPNPITIDNRFKHNIFRLDNGDLAIVIVSMDRSALIKSPPLSNINICINIPEAKEVSAAYVYSVDFENVLNLNIVSKDDHINLTLPHHHSTSLIYLQKKTR